MTKIKKIVDQDFKSRFDPDFGILSHHWPDGIPTLSIEKKKENEKCIELYVLIPVLG